MNRVCPDVVEAVGYVLSAHERDIAEDPSQHTWVARERRHKPTATPNRSGRAACAPKLSITPTGVAKLVSMRRVATLYTASGHGERGRGSTK